MQTTTVEEVKARLSAGEPLNFLDVREAGEREEYNIGGTHLPMSNIMNFETEEIDHLKDQELIVYCRSGNRSQQACMFLEQCGFTNTYNLAGGMNEWRK